VLRIEIPDLSAYTNNSARYLHHNAIAAMPVTIADVTWVVGRRFLPGKTSSQTYKHYNAILPNVMGKFSPATKNGGVGERNEVVKDKKIELNIFQKFSFLIKLDKE